MTTRRERRDQAAAGVLAGIIMLGGVVAFLAYMNVSWVPTWVQNREAAYSEDVGEASSSWAAAVDTHVAGGLEGRTFTQSYTLGLGGIPMLGTGSSAAEVALVQGPSVNVSVGGVNVFNASGALVVTTHTTRYPAQVHRYALGALEVNQSEGAWVNARSFLHAERTTGGRLSVAIQGVTLTGWPQAAGGSGSAEVGASVTDITNLTPASGEVRIQITNASAAAWRAALQRELNSTALTVQNTAGCSGLAATTHACFDASTNTAATVDLRLINVADGWTATHATLAVAIRK